MRIIAAVVLVIASFAGAMSLSFGGESAHTPADPTQLAAGERNGGHHASAESVQLDLSEVPLPTGWFLIPLESDEAGLVHVRIEVELNFTEDRLKVAAPIIAGDHFIRPMVSVAHSPKEVTVHAQGEEVSCCTDPSYGSDGGAVWSSSYPTSPDAPLYVGLVASGLSEHDAFSLQASSEQMDLRVGEPLTGTAVEVIDLFEASARGEPGVRVGGQHLVGEHQDIQRRWTGEQTGFVAVSWEMEDARGDIRLTTPGMGAFSIAPSQGSSGMVSRAFQPGEATLSFTNVTRSGDMMDGRPTGRAIALFADLALPYSGLEGVLRYS